MVEQVLPGAAENREVTVKRPWVVAHRGARREAPENTASSFERALTYPVNGIELDVQLTRDHVPVIYHDRTLWKISKEKDRILDKTYLELKGLDFGSWYNPEFKGEKVLTFPETLAALFSRTKLFVEIKSRGWDRRAGTSEILTEMVIEQLRRERDRTLQRLVFILTFDRRVLAYAMKLEPSFHYILNVTSPAHLKPSDLEQFPNAWGLCTNINRLTQGFADTVRAHGKKVLTYTVNTPRQALMGFKTGVDVMFTDKPSWLIPYLDREFGPA